MVIAYNYTTKEIDVDATATLRSVYSDAMDVFAAAAQMDDLIPLRADTPTLFTLINGWTFSTASIAFLTSAALQDSAGDNIWTNIQTLGTIVAGTTLYIEQNSAVVYTHGTTGHINILFKTKSAGTEIDSQLFKVYARLFQQEYSSFSTTGGAIVSNVPLSTKSDPQLDISAVTIAAYTGLTITWGAVNKSAGDLTGTATITIASPGVVTKSSHGLVIGDSIEFSTTGALPTGLAVATEYFVITAGYTANAFQLSATAGGSAINTSGTQSGVHTIDVVNKQYSIVVDCGGKTLKEAYNWVQSELLLGTDIDDGAGTELGKLTDALTSYTSSMITAVSVWFENFAAADANSIKYTDNDGTLHTPPVTVAISVDAVTAMAGGRVAIYSLASAYDASTYVPGDIVETLLDDTLDASGDASATLTYLTDVNVVVRVRKAGYKPFEVGTSVTSSGLAVTSINEADTIYS